ncbi:MAG: hypothetical protein H7095_02070 [Pseudopedobacter sp.]|nr:hypothetical protein [Deinococcales bacterium]
MNSAGNKMNESRTARAVDGLNVLLRWRLSKTPILNTSRPTLRPLTLEDAPEL